MPSRDTCAASAKAGTELATWPRPRLGWGGWAQATPASSSTAMSVLFFTTTGSEAAAELAGTADAAVALAAALAPALATALAVETALAAALAPGWSG
eukprot:5619007-Alexandrium_andersonii.AAC.1